METGDRRSSRRGPWSRELSTFFRDDHSFGRFAKTRAAEAIAAGSGSYSAGATVVGSNQMIAAAPQSLPGESMLDAEGRDSAEPQSGRTPPPPRCRVAFAFRLDGDLRFISHHDTLRLFRRALARAGLPVKFSQGFNPHPRITLPLPRPVGVATEADLLVVEFNASVSAEQSRIALAGQLPSGIELTDARLLPPGPLPQPALAIYRVPLDELSPSEVSRRAAEIEQSSSLVVLRRVDSENATRSIDVRPYVARIVVAEDHVEMALRVTGGGTARPAEIAGLLGFDPDTVLHRVRRVEVQWQSK